MGESASAKSMSDIVRPVPQLKLYSLSECEAAEGRGQVSIVALGIRRQGCSKGTGKHMHGH